MSDAGIEQIFGAEDDFVVDEAEDRINDELANLFAPENAEKTPVDDEIEEPKDDLEEEEEEKPEEEDEEEQKEDDEDDDEEEPEEGESEEEPKKFSARAEKRFRTLANDNKALKEQLEQTRAQSEQLTNYVAQMQQYLQQQEQKKQQTESGEREALLAHLRRQQEAEERARLEAEEAGLSYADKFKRQLQREIRNEYKSEIEAVRKEVAARERKLIEAQEAQRKQAILAQQKQQAFETFKTGAEKARQDILLKDIDTAKLSPEELSVVEDMLFAYTAVKNTQPEVSAVQWRKILDKLVEGRNRSVSKGPGKKLKTGKGVPSSQVSGRRTGKKDYRPSRAALEANGYGDGLWADWALDGKPQLKEPKRSK